MPDVVVVTPRWNHSSIRMRRGLNHAATIDAEGIYVWCYGPTTEGIWHKAPEGAPVNCLTCLAYGPRDDWQPHPMGRMRIAMKDGRRYGVVDSETET
jgi:hypothetical protein